MALTSPKQLRDIAALYVAYAPWSHIFPSSQLHVLLQEKTLTSERTEQITYSYLLFITSIYVCRRRGLCHGMHVARGQIEIIPLFPQWDLETELGSSGLVPSVPIQSHFARPLF